jgi:hypothetical protein
MDEDLIISVCSQFDCTTEKQSLIGHQFFKEPYKHTTQEDQEAAVVYRRFASGEDHTNTQKGIKPYLCTECLKTYAYASSMSKHKLVLLNISHHYRFFHFLNCVGTFFVTSELWGGIYGSPSQNHKNGRFSFFSCRE